MALVSQLKNALQTPTNIAFAVTESGPNTAVGDYFSALELGSALARRYAWQVTYLPMSPAWYDLSQVDVLLVMRQDYDLRLIHSASPNLLTIAWARNWFEAWQRVPWLSDYSLVTASSQFAARHLSAHCDRLVYPLRIATNPARFDGTVRAAKPEFDFIFTGSYWGSQRDIVPALMHLQGTFSGAIFGKNWDQVPALQPLYRGFVPYAQLPVLYQRAMLVIDDANHVTKHWAAANSRVFDALAAGCLVITNSDSVSKEVFGGQLPFFSSPEELKDLVAHYLTDTPAREQRLQQLRAHVLREHTYDHRAVALYSLIRKLRLASSEIGRHTSTGTGHA